MKTTIARVKAMSLAAIALGALSASAEIKYWDNPAYRAFDVGDYVQNGLLLHYDGIRNAGAAADHDSSATVWKNLGTGGAAYDMLRGGAAQSSAWMEKGYRFGNDAYFRSASKHELDEYYELETLVDAKASDVTALGYIYTRVFADVWHGSDSAWNGGSIALRPEWTQSSGNSGYLVFNTHFYTANRPIVPKAISTFDYITAIGDSTSAAVFTGLVMPTAAPGYIGPNAEYSSNPWKKRNPAYIYLGGHENGTGVGETFKGTIRNFRYYSRILTDAERVWNRAVDEARFFGRAVALPVTNVVVASNIPIAFGDEPIGCYAVDGTHVFSAPASKVIKGRTYTLNGYTVEIWDGEKWGAAQEVAAGSGDSMSYTAADNALVRLTWRWTAGDGLVNYDADDYVRNGLLLNYDGIRNAGLEAPHDSSATVWKNLGNGGEMYDMIRHSITDGVFAEASGAGGRWGSDGFYFDKAVLFHLRDANKFTVGTAYTLQTLVNATAADQEGTVYLMCPSIKDNANEWLRFSIGIRNNEFDYGGVKVPTSMYHCAYDNAGASRAALPGTDFSYANVMLNGNKAVIFSGTQVAWSGTPSTGYMCDESKTPNARTYTKGISLGGRWPEATPGQMFKGMLHAYRHYDRVLNDDELAWNRTVDNARFFPVTNVVVATTRTGVFANEKDGAYQVSGSYTFTAPESVTVGKFTYAPVGYAVQVWDEACGVWGKATEYTGNAYAYSTSAGKVRLLWRWKVIKGIRTLADYDVTDYIAGGLLLNYDGIRNAGVSAGHDSSANVWVNLGTAGAGNNAVLSNEVDAAGYWTASGYKFDGKCRFIAKMAYNPTYTLQFLSDAIQNDQSDHANRTIYFICGDANNRFAYATYNQYLYPRVQNNGNDANLKMQIDKTKPIGYVTSIQDQLGKSVSVFSGTVAPVSGANCRAYESMLTDTSFADVCIGGWKWSLDQNLRGGINYFRYYDRVLSEAELAWNREVDEARYFGVVSETNVVVVAGGEGAVQAETGAFKVDGEWTFTASKTVDAGGRVVDVARYAVEELVDGVWTNRKIHSGNAYTYTKGASSPTVRLKWLGRPLGVTIVVR